MGRPRLTIADIQSQIESLLSKYEGSIETLRLTRYDMDLTPEVRAQAKKDLDRLRYLRNLLRSRSFVQSSALAAMSNNATSRVPDSTVPSNMSNNENEATVSDSRNSESIDSNLVNNGASSRRSLSIPSNTNVQNSNIDAEDDWVLLPNTEDVSESCENCHRHQNYHDPTYNIDFVDINSSDIRTHRNYSFLDRNGECQYHVCSQCKDHLTHSSIGTAYLQKFTFAAFMWSIFTNECIHRIYGGNFIWSLVPLEWRPWFIVEVKLHFPAVFLAVSLVSPSSIIVDKTNAIMDWNNKVGKYELSSLRDCCNKYLLPVVLCPWGCTDFMHRCGYISFEAMYQRVLRKVNLNLRNIDEYIKCMSVRDDFVRSNIEDYDVLLYNTDWKVLPSICFKDNTPMFLTCRFHDGGSKKLMVHVPRWLNNLPSARSDQHAQAVIQPNCIKPMQTAGFSHRYQMYRQNFSMKGVESINLSTQSDFGHHSLLLWESEARSIANRSDLTAHLNNLALEKKLSPDQVNAMSQYAIKYCSKVDMANLAFGSTYVPLEVAMLMQKEANDRLIVVVDASGSETSRFNRVWYSYLYPCQSMNSHGAQFISVPKFSRNSTSWSIWQLSAMFLCIEPLWKILSTKEFYLEHSWYGFLMSYLSKNCIMFNSRRQQKSDVFKVETGSTIELMSKVPHLQSTTFHHLFIEFSAIMCIDISHQNFPDAINVLFNNYIDCQFRDIILISGITTSNDLPEEVTIIDEKFELVFLSSVFLDNNNRWDSIVYCRHGRSFKSWWFQKRDDDLFIQVDSLPELSHQSYVAVYVKFTSIDFQQHKMELLKLLGGQTHLLCENHRLPLISSCRKYNCACNTGRKREYLRCSVPSCRVGLCKRCYQSFDTNTTTFISRLSVDPNITNVDEISNDSSSSSSVSSDNSFNYDFYNNNVVNNRNNDRHDDPVVQEEIPELIQLNDGDGDDSLDGMFDNGLNNRDIINNNEDNMPELEDRGVHWADTPDVDIDEFHDIFDGFEFVLDSAGLENEIPTTNAGNERLIIETETSYGGVDNEYTIGGSGLLVETTPLLTRKNYNVTGSNRDKHFVQRFCATTSGTSVPILWPEATMFPSIFYTDSPDKYSIAGAIPSSLLSLTATNYGFASIPDHVRNRVTLPFSTTSTDPRYISFCYDLLANLSANFNDTRMFSRHGLRSGDDATGGLEQRGTNDSELNNAVDSRQEVLNLCASLGYFEWDFFLTFTCNQKKHFGTSVIKDWIDGDNWKDSYAHYYNLPIHHQNEISRALIQSAQGLLLRVWEEVSALFIDLLKRSSKSPFFKTFALFARKEYQANEGNLSHIHAMLKVAWHLLRDDEKKFISSLIRASICDVIRSDEVDHYIGEGLIESHDDVSGVEDDVRRFASHKCDSRCLVPRPDGTLRCRKLQLQSITMDTTKDRFMNLPRNFSLPCIKRLIRCGLAVGVTDDEGKIIDFISSCSYFHPKRFVPRSSKDVVEHNISPVETSTFIACRSMQNIQRLKGCGECCKYCCKYIGKIDEQNYLHVAVGKHGELIRQAYFLHNTKITSSKIAQEKEREKTQKSRSKYEVHGRITSVNEMLHHILKYPDVFTDVEFKKIQTTSLEFRAGTKLILSQSIKKKKKNTTENNESTNNINNLAGDVTTTEINNNEENNEENNDSSIVIHKIVVYREETLTQFDWRHATEYQNVLLGDISLRSSTKKIDTVTQFSLRPPELLRVCDMVGSYFRWFHIENKSMKEDEYTKLLVNDIWSSAWIDLLQCQVKLRRKAFSEISNWLTKIEDEEDFPNTMVSVVRKIFYVYRVDYDSLSEPDKEFFEFARDNLVKDEGNKHLPIPVYDFIKPTMGPQFLHHLLLSMGRFDTELDLLLHTNVKDCFRYAKLIGDNDDSTSLEKYSNGLMNLYVKEQLCYYPNGQGTIDSWIVYSGELFDSVIIRNEIPVSEMPSVLVSALLSEHGEEVDRYVKKIREDMVDAAIRELGQAVIDCNIPSRESLVNASLENPVEWDAVANFKKSPNQSDESYIEQLRAVRICAKQIDSHCNWNESGTYTKNVILSGFPGAGKSFLLMYVGIYSLCKGLFSLATAMMAHRAVQLGGIHWHKLLCIPTENNISINRRAEVAIHKLARKPKKLELLQRINVFLSDEKSQHSSEMIQCIDLICRRVLRINLLYGGILEIATMDNSQLQPINGRPFLTYSNVIPCFKMIPLQKSVRASNDERFYRLQQITRLEHTKFAESPELIEEFKSLAEGFTFVDSWQDPRITPSTFRVYSKQVPAKEAAKNFLISVRATIPPNERIHRKSLDYEKRRRSRRDWVMSSESTSTALESRLKEPRELLFFRGAVYQCTYNEDEKFNQSQHAFCFDLPSQEDVDMFRPVKVLLFPPTMKYENFQYRPDLPKQYYLEKGFTEISMTTAPERIQYLSNDIQGKRKQYGLKHYISGTIHSTMGDQYKSMATSTAIKLWEKGQLVVLCSRTRYMIDTIFVGNKEETINALCELLGKRTMWSDYMNKVMDIITIDESEDTTPRTNTYFEYSSFPFRVRDISLPQAQTGYVFFMKSARDDTCIYIDTTNCLRTRLIRHNSGFDSSLHPPADKRPFILLGYICGFDRKKDLMTYVKNEWRIRADVDYMKWLKSGQEIINGLQQSNIFNIENSDLSLICLFKEY